MRKSDVRDIVDVFCNTQNHSCSLFCIYCQIDFHDPVQDSIYIFIYTAYSMKQIFKLRMYIDKQIISIERIFTV